LAIQTVLPRKVDHPAARMAKCHVAQLMRDHTRQFLRRYFACAEFVVEPARDKDAPVGGGKTVHRLDLVDMHFDAWNIQRGGQLFVDRHQRRISQHGGFLVQLAPRAPNGKAVHSKAVEHGKEDREDFEHKLNMARIDASARAMSPHSHGLLTIV